MEWEQYFFRVVFDIHDTKLLQYLLNEHNWKWGRIIICFYNGLFSLHNPIKNVAY